MMRKKLSERFGNCVIPSGLSGVGLGVGDGGEGMGLGVGDGGGDGGPTPE
jgi:hypothetical protein